MAKSIRSKWKRKMRAIKRERYGKKELERLKKTVGCVGLKESVDLVNDNDLTEIATVTSSKEVLAKMADALEKEGDSDEDVVEVEGNTSKYNPKTMKDENGAYPPWMSQRRIKKQAASNKGKSTKHKKENFGKKTKRRKKM